MGMISASFFPDWANGIAVAAFIIGIISVVEEFFVYFQRTRERILVFKLISDAIKVVQLSLTYAYTGAVLNGVAIAREIVFYNKDKRKWAGHRCWLYIFIVLMFVAPLITPVINGTTKVFSADWFVNFLPAVGSAIAVIGFYKSDPHLIRTTGLVGTSLWWIYSLYAHLVYAPNIMQVIANTLALVSTVYGLIVDRKMLRIMKESLREKSDKSKQPAQTTQTEK